MAVVNDYTALLAYLEGSYMRWNNPADLGMGAIVTYSFPETGELPSIGSYNPYGASSYSSFTEAQRANFRDAVAVYSALSGLVFVEVDSGGMIEAFASSGAAAGGWANLPVSTSNQVSTGRLVVNRSDAYDEGTYGFLTLLHEIGHAVGLNHPHEGNLTLNSAIDNLTNTVMSYNISSQGGVYTSQLGVFDVQAVQHLYGLAQDTSAWIMGYVGQFFQVRANSGDDRIMGISGQNKLIGYGGNDQLIGRMNVDYLYGGGGNDSIDGQMGNDILKGGNGNDSIYGAQNNDKLYGDNGHDTLEGGAGNDTIFGGDGHDVIYGEEDGGANYTEADILLGGEGNDTIYGQGGNDRLKGDGGNDWLEGGAGSDVMHGGDGNDMMIGDGANDSFGNDTMYGCDGDDEMYGAKGSDLMYGNTGNDRLYGGEGNDLLYGNSGDDRIWGDTGADTIDGGAGHDLIYGGDGADLINGSFGYDTLEGGAGADVFVMSEDGFGAMDTITDFEDGIDRIDLGETFFTPGDVVITAQGADTMITVGGAGGVAVLLLGIDASQIDAFNDFYY